MPPKPGCLPPRARLVRLSRALVVKLVNTADLKSAAYYWACRFKSGRGHHSYPVGEAGFWARGSNMRSGSGRRSIAARQRSPECKTQSPHPPPIPALSRYPGTKTSDGPNHGLPSMAPCLRRERRIRKRRERVLYYW